MLPVWRRKRFGMKPEFYVYHCPNWQYLSGFLTALRLAICLLKSNPTAGKKKSRRVVHLLSVGTHYDGCIVLNSVLALCYSFGVVSPTTLPRPLFTACQRYAKCSHHGK